MPRALTEQEKCRICDKLLEKGKDIVLSQGIRRVSVDEITKAAGMAKGSFYQHFESKEHFLYELVMSIHRQIYAQAEQMINAGGDSKSSIRELLTSLFQRPELAFLTRNYQDINDLFASMPDCEIQSEKQMEADMLEKLLVSAGIDTRKVKPGVVHNYLHTLFIMKGSDLMIEDDLPETVEIFMDNLLSYIFGGAR
jgi:AcrR family transcriptional regulator